MRAIRLALVTFAAAATAGAAMAQQAAAPPAAPPPTEPSEAQPLPVYSGTNGEVAPGQASSPEPVYALVGAHLVSGVTQPGAHGPLTLVSDADPAFVCSARGDRDVRLACSDGSHVRFSVQPFTDDAGCGRTHAGPAASLCYGFKAKYAARRLSAPHGASLRVEDGRLVLKRIAG